MEASKSVLANTETLKEEVVKIETELKKFKNSEIFDSFLSGIWWGLIILALLNIGAWLVSVMRQRVIVTRSLPMSPKEETGTEENSST